MLQDLETEKLDVVITEKGKRAAIKHRQTGVVISETGDRWRPNFRKANTSMGNLEIRLCRQKKKKNAAKNLNWSLQ